MLITVMVVTWGVVTTPNLFILNGFQAVLRFQRIPMILVLFLPQIRHTWVWGQAWRAVSATQR